MVVTRDEFNSFHKIDRNLFCRLVFGLNRDNNQTFQVMGFLLLLEQTGYARGIIGYLVTLPDAFIDSFANEVVVCLSFLLNHDFATTFFVTNNTDGNSMIPLIIRLTGGRLTLRSINQDREIFHHGLIKISSDVCDRAFEDLMETAERLNRENIMAIERENLIEEMRRVRLGVQQQETNNRSSVQQVPIHPPPPPPPAAAAIGEQAKKTVAETVTTKRDEEATRMTADDRTVFLTFSKGYPISEEEVRVYFTRRFGEMIEAIEMQEVEEHDQPLYAKMVLKMRCASKMEEIVSARSRNKFTINGKHVWARKYVPRNP